MNHYIQVYLIMGVIFSVLINIVVIQHNKDIYLSKSLGQHITGFAVMAITWPKLLWHFCEGFME